MNSVQVLTLLLGLSVISVVFSLADWIQDRFKFPHRQRLALLKLSLFVSWGLGLSSILAFILQKRNIGRDFFPDSEALNRVMAQSETPLVVMQDRFLTGGNILLAVYILGLGFFLGRIFIGWLRMRGLFLKSSEVQLGKVSVRCSEEISSPFSFGLLSPRIFIPASWLSIRTPTEIEAMLVHEQTHVENRDPQWKIASLVTRAFLFFLPTAFYLHRQLDLEMEIECDRLTMMRTQLSKKQYGSFLIDMVDEIQSFNINSMSTYMTQTNLRRRITAMTENTKRKPLLSIALGFLIAAASLTTVAATTGISKTPKAVKVSVELFINGEKKASPSLISLINETALIEVGPVNQAPDFRMKVLAKEAGPEYGRENIELNMEVDYKTSKDEISARPRLLMSPGVPGTIELGSQAGSLIEMRVLAEYQE